MGSEVTKLLRKARALLAKPGGWTQGELSRGASGRPVGEVRSRHAVSFCSVGAVCRAAGDRDPAGEAVEVLDDVVGESITLWNDNPKRKKSEVLKAFTKAIEVSRGK